MKLKEKKKRKHGPEFSKTHTHTQTHSVVQKPSKNQEMKKEIIF